MYIAKLFFLSLFIMSDAPSHPEATIPFPLINDSCPCDMEKRSNVYVDPVLGKVSKEE